MPASRRATLAPLVVSAVFAFAMNACTAPTSIGGGPLPTVTPAATATPAPGTTATPAPGTTATPTAGPTPAAALVVNPTSLAFIGTGAPLAASFTASETSYSGAFTESDTCSGIATVVAGSAGSYTITPSGAGSCNVTIADSFAQKAVVAVSVTVTGGVIQ